MNREEQILQQAELSFGSQREYAAIFAQGARWADRTSHDSQRVYIIAERYDTDDKELKGLLKGTLVTYFRTREKAEEYVQRYTDLQEGQYEIISFMPYIFG